MSFQNRNGVALTVAIIVILMMTAVAGFIYVPPDGSNPAKYGPGSLSSLAFNVFRSTYTLSNGRTLAYYRARAALVDAQERIRTNNTVLDSGDTPLTTFASTSSKNYYFNMSLGVQRSSSATPPRLEWVYVNISTPNASGLRTITVTAPDVPDGT